MHDGLYVGTSLTERAFQSLVGNQGDSDLKECLGHAGLINYLLPLLQIPTSSLSPASCSLMSLTGQDGVSLLSSHG